MPVTDWHAWHERYDRPDSSLAQRLRVVQERVRLALDACPPGPLRVVSVCAGQGRDLLGVLPDHPRRDDVSARLVELDPANVAIARQTVRTEGLHGVEVVEGDAALPANYTGMVPADVVLVCGVFGNITDEDVHRTIEWCTRLCGRGATVVWTRHREPPDLVPQVCEWFRQHGFELVWLSDPDAGFGVGVHRFAGEPRPWEPADQRVFTFV